MASLARLSGDKAEKRGNIPWLEIVKGHGKYRYKFMSVFIDSVQISLTPEPTAVIGFQSDGSKPL